MQKQPFTQAGFVALQAELYALDDALLQVEADAIILNFKGWINRHFELDQTQLDFLNEIDQRCIYFLETQTSFAVNNRLQVTLNKEEDPEEGEETGKVIKPKSRFTVTASNSDVMIVEGNLEIQIYYES